MIKYFSFPAFLAQFLIEIKKQDFMKRNLLLILFTTTTLLIQAQKDSVTVASGSSVKSIRAEAAAPDISIYPVPIRENFFTIKCDKPVASVRITNIIGQDILKLKNNNPETIMKIVLDNPKRGMYLVTVILDDGSRVVKKIMIEQAE